MFVDSKAQRKKKLEHFLHQEIAKLLQNILYFERGAENMRVTVMEVHASKDLRKVNVFLSTSLPEVFEVIRQKSGKIRHILAEQVNIRRIPELYFLPWKC